MTSFVNQTSRSLRLSRLLRAASDGGIATRWRLPLWRSVATTSPRLSTQADVAPESTSSDAGPVLPFARPIPVSPSYFSRSPKFNDGFVQLQEAFQKYGHLPKLPPDEVERVAWKTVRAYRSALGEKVKASTYTRCLAMVKKLHAVHPALLPEEARRIVDSFKTTHNPFLNVPKPIVIDEHGRACGVGRRKASTARAWVVEGTGEVMVNGKRLNEAFGRIHDRESAVWALKATERMDKYNVWAIVEGGGTTGQAEALTLAIAKALLAHEPALKPALRRGTRARFRFEAQVQAN